MTEPSSKTSEEIIIWGSGEDWARPATQAAFLTSVFKDEGFTRLVLEQIETAGLTISGNADLLGVCTQLIEALKGAGDPQMAALAQGQKRALNLFTAHVQGVTQVYHRGNKPDESAVFWPDPTRENGVDLRDVLPFVQRHPVLNQDTPMGNAGSCFAFELSHAMQRRGFNYVITEPVPDGTDGVWGRCGPGANQGSGFLCALGLLFNSPSFAQLAERAFGRRLLTVN